jgi:hypothetical protein
MKQACWNRFVALLEHDDEMWGIEDVAAGILWVNAKQRALTGRDTVVPTVVSLSALPEAVRVRDAVSLAIKTRTNTSVNITVGEARMCLRVFPPPCPGCANAITCGLVLGHLAPLAKPVAPSPRAHRDQLD